MSSDAIFLQVSGKTMHRAPASGYVTESDLQRLLAEYPALLASDQIDEDDPPRWLLVSREAGVPDSADAGNRWSVDHLLVDHRAVPTFVEVKRSSDTRIRREIVGQMLDYAANATTYWPVDRIRTLAAVQYGGADALDERVGLLLAVNGDERADAVERFWREVEENLRSSRVRLLFVADVLPRELRRIIEFLNEQLPRIEVLGVELRKYEAEGVQALVPRVVGQTERSRAARSAITPKRKRTPAEFLSGLPADIRGLYQQILAAASNEGAAVEWGTRSFSVGHRLRSGTKAALLWAYEPGTVGREYASLEFYDKDLVGTPEGAEFRQALVMVPGMIEAGGYTLRLPLTPENVATADRTMPPLWQACRAIRARDESTAAGT